MRVCFYDFGYQKDIFHEPYQTHLLCFILNNKNILFLFYLLPVFSDITVKNVLVSLISVSDEHFNFSKFVEFVEKHLLFSILISKFHKKTHIYIVS